LGYISLNENYIFGTSLLESSFIEKNIRKNLHISTIQLALYWICIWFTIYIISNPKKNFKQDNLFDNIKYYEIVLFISIIGFLISINENTTQASLFKKNISNDISIFRFFFADHAIVIYSVILFFYLKNKSHYSDKLIEYKFLLLLFLYFINFSFQLSKGASYFLIISIFIGITTFNRYQNFKIILPKFIFLLLISFTTYFTFISLNIYRSYYAIYDGFYFLPYFEIIENHIFKNNQYFYLESIVIRLSTGGLEQFLLINESFSKYNFTFSLQFTEYMLKNFVNIMLPGTIYFESYLPSSQIFNDIILDKKIYGQSSKIDLMNNLNAQPYTAFGLSIILFGKYLSYIAVTLYFFLIQKLSICIKNKLFKATMGSLFWTSLIIFSFEVMIGETVHLFFQLYFIHILVKSLSSLPGVLKKF
jgi:hypothetical protein